MAVIECFFQNCFRVDEDSSHQISPEEFQAPMSPQTLALEREICLRINQDTRDYDTSSSSSLNQGPESYELPSSNPLSASNIISTNNQQDGFQYVIQNIFKSIERGFFNNRALDPPPHEKLEKVAKIIDVHASPLRTATVYKSLDDIPSIASEEVVMPGSTLQRQMSIRLKDKGILSESSVDECVICMEAFDEFNPRMPTLCGCGENKTYFHLPCLYQWVEKCNECPSCREPLAWQEF